MVTVPQNKIDYAILSTIVHYKWNGAVVAVHTVCAREIGCETPTNPCEHVLEQYAAQVAFSCTHLKADERLL
jgi:hypothetical protein